MATYQCRRCDAIVTGYHRRCPNCKRLQCLTMVPHLPSQEEIAAECAKIRETWSEYEERKRRREPECAVETLDLYVGWNRVNRRQYRD